MEIEQIKEGSNKTNTLSIIALICSFIVPLIGLVLGIIAKNQIKKSGEKGKGLAIAAINISIIFILIFSFIGFYFIRHFFISPPITPHNFDKIPYGLIDALKTDCESDLCLEASNRDIIKNKEENLWAIIYNKFDCDITNLNISIGGVSGGSTNFGDNTCQILSVEGSKCSDIMIQNIPLRIVAHKEKQEVLIQIRAKSSAKPTLYSYDLEVKGSCQYSGNTYNIYEKVPLTINVIE